MALRYIRDSLPWLVPSAAVVFAATVFIDNNNSTESQMKRVIEQYVTGTQSDTVEPRATGNTTQAIATALGFDQTEQEQNVVARQDTSALDLAPAPRAELPTQQVVQPEVVEVVQPEPIEPEPEPVREAALAAPVTTPTFSAATFNSNANDQCREDLKSLAEQTKVYFPAGGLTADQNGIEQGRVIGLIAQSCSGVRIRVEGHSDPSGDPAANLRLSQARAEAVIKRIGASGLDTSMFFAEGLGDRVPSGTVGPESSAYYDRRVQFSIVDQAQRVALRQPATTTPWTSAACVDELQRAVDSTALFYAPGSVSLPSNDIDTAMQLAEMAMDCPQARLRVVGHHSAEANSRETIQTARLRAKALMAMLVGRGVASEQIIIAAPSRAAGGSGLPGSRVNFDVILEDG